MTYLIRVTVCPGTLQKISANNVSRVTTRLDIRQRSVKSEAVRRQRSSVIVSTSAPQSPKALDFACDRLWGYYSKEAHVKNAQFATGCFVEGTVEDSLIFRKVNIAKGAEVRKSIIMQGAEIGEGAILEYCILDKNVTIGPGVTLKGTKDNIVVIEKNKTLTV